MKFWGVLGRQGCREKKLPTAISNATFWGVFFNFLQAKNNQKFFKNIFESASRRLKEGVADRPPMY